MCGRFTLSPKTSQIEHLLPGVKNFNSIKPKYNIAPTQKIATVLNDDKREITSAIWGLIPSWAKDPSIGNKLINARSETINEKPSFKYPFRKKRCIIIATGFYEWKKVAGTNKKVPYYIKLKSDEVFAFAGLWDSWKHPDGNIVNSAAIITTSSNNLMEPIHNRMPVILNNKTCEIWLDNSSKIELLSGLLVPFNDELMKIYEVSSLVNNPSFDSPECILPVKN